MNSPELKGAWKRYWERGLLPLVITVLVVALWDFQSRLMVDEVAMPDASSEESAFKKPKRNRSILPAEARAIFKYLDALAPGVLADLAESESESEAESESGSLNMDLELANINERLFGEVGFRVLAIFDGVETFAVIERLDKLTQERALMEVKVGGVVNGYKIELLSKVRLDATNALGDSVTMVMFERDAGEQI